MGSSSLKGFLVIIKAQLFFGVGGGNCASLALGCLDV